MSGMVESVFEQLVAGKSPEAVRSTVSSSSKFTSGLQKYLKWGKAEAAKVQEDLASLQEKRRKVSESTSSLQVQAEELARKIQDLTQAQLDLTKEVQTKEGHLEWIERRVKQTGTELKEIQSRAEKLSLKDYTSELVQKLSASDAAHGGELLGRVQTLEKYEAEILSERGALEKLSADREEAKRELEELNARIQAARKEVGRLEESLSKRREEERLFEGLLEECRKVLADIRTASEEVQRQHRVQLEEYGNMKIEAGKLASDVERYSELERKAAHIFKENEELRRQVSDLSVENSKLKEAATTNHGGRSIESKEALTKSGAEEVQTKATGLFQEYRARWEKTDGRSWVNRKANDIVTSIIKELRKPPGRRYFPDEWWKAKLPREIEEILKAEAKARSDSKPVVKAKAEAEQGKGQLGS
jgi:chromosome segregation ATPase